MPVRAVPLVEIHRGAFLESLHCGHAVLWDHAAGLVEAWGDAEAEVLPRSSAKMIQALPLVMSGASEAARLGPRELALACASHSGAPMHVAAVNDWLGRLGLDDAALACGPQPSRDKALRHDMIRRSERPCRVHNNCSGKHTGFLTLARHLGAVEGYVTPGHPVQRAVFEAFETVTDRAISGYGIDGCSAPNPATSMAAMAKAMAFFAAAGARQDRIGRAAVQLVDAMIAHPELVAGEDRACTRLMRAARERVALKTGAEGVFVAILPERGQGIAIKIADGATRAAESAIAAMLVRLGALDPDHPDVAAFLAPEIRNWDGLITGAIRPVAALGRPAVRRADVASDAVSDALRTPSGDPSPT